MEDKKDKSEDRWEIIEDWIEIEGQVVNDGI